MFDAASVNILLIWEITNKWLSCSPYIGELCSSKVKRQRVKNRPLLQGYVTSNDGMARRGQNGSSCIVYCSQY